MPFSRFMEWCLYHPDYGYYQSGGARVGRGGDYYTAPSVHPLFGCMVARQLLQMSELVGTERFTVVEMGAGRGFLCLDILDWARGNAPAFYRRLDYRLADRSRRLIREQKERLAPYAGEGKVSWEEEGEGERGEGMIDGCFLSNELVDAFPVHRVVFQGADSGRSTWGSATAISSTCPVIFQRRRSANTSAMTGSNWRRGRRRR